MSTLYLKHFGLIEAPFTITPNPQFFYAGAQRGALARALAHALRDEDGIVVLTGEVGSGKTMLCRMLLAESAPDLQFVYLANPAFSGREIVAAIARDLGVAAEDDALTTLERLQRALIERHAANRRVVVIIDEAHTMSPEALDEVRRLTNIETAHRKLLGIVLCGQPELDALLARPELRPLRDRIAQRFELPPLPRADVPEYLRCRMYAAGYRGGLPFEPSALRRLQSASRGLVRRINLLADRALLACFARGGLRVCRADVMRAQREIDGFGMSWRRRLAAWWARARAMLDGRRGRAAHPAPPAIVGGET